LLERRMSWKLSRTVRRRGKGSDYFKALPIPIPNLYQENFLWYKNRCYTW